MEEEGRIEGVKERESVQGISVWLGSVDGARASWMKFTF
jgi:hypothetical protein